MLTLSQVTKSFFHKPVLNQVSIQVQGGRMAGLLGRNGSGKSTLLRIIAGLSALDNGEILINGETVKSNNPVSRRQSLYLGHAPGLYPPLSAMENLRIAGRFYGVNIGNARLLEILREVGLDRQFTDPIRVFSQGMTQRLKLALAIALPWSVLLFDEPFTGLDIEGRQLTEKLLESWKSPDRLLLLVVHDHRWANDHCDDIYVIRNGKVKLSEGPITDESALQTHVVGAAI